MDLIRVCMVSWHPNYDNYKNMHPRLLFLKLTFSVPGIDVNAKDAKQQTVMDLLVSHPSARTREIGNLVYGKQIEAGRGGGWGKVEFLHWGDT